MQSLFRESPARPFRPSSARLLAAAVLAAAFAGCSSEEAAGPADDGLLTLTKPSGGETFKVGDTLWIEWTVKEDPDGTVTAVDPKLSPDDGATWVNLRSGSIAPGTPSWGRWGYKLPDSILVPSKNAKMALRGNSKVRVRVEEYTDRTISSTSKSAISIAP